MTAVRRVLASPIWRRRLVTVAVGLLLTAVPLVGTLGYEHAFVIAPLASLGGMATGVDAVRRARASGAATRLRGLLASSAGELAVLCVLAFAMPLVGQLWQRACEPLGGTAFFVVGPVMSAALGLVAGLWGGVLGRTRGRALLLAATPMIASTLIGLWRLFAEPVVFAYDPFFGYFSGSVYDEAVSVGATYLTFRAYNLAVAGVALLAFAAAVTPALAIRRPSAAVLAGLGAAAVACGAVGLRASRLGFTADLDSITEVLSATRETEHFIIHYAPRSADARTIDAIAAEHEFAWATLRTAMNGREPEGRVRSFVFASTDQKRKLMGAGTVQVAAPWRRQIYLDHRPFPHPVLHHELAHVFGATVGDAIFGVSRAGTRINVGLIEGFATAMAPREAERLDLHDQAAVLQKLGKLPPMGAIMGPGFLAQASQVAYTAAGSFCLWLVETRGFEPMAALYHSAGDFVDAYGSELAPLEAEWLAFLAARDGIRDVDVAAARQRFERRSVFERPCAHRVAEVRSEIDRALARGEGELAIERWHALCALEPEQPEHTLGLAQTLATEDHFDDAERTLAELATREDLTTTIRATIAERRGDVALATGAFDRAAAAYAEALALPQSDQRLRVLQLRAFGAQRPAFAQLVLDYFAPFDGDDDGIVKVVTSTWAAAELSRAPEAAALGHYLLGRQLLNAERPAAADVELARALERGGEGLPTPEFVRAARAARLESALLIGEFATAKAVLAELEAEPELPRGYASEWAQWRERIAFFETYAAAPP